MASLRALACALPVVGALFGAPCALADHVVWFTPNGARLTGSGALTTPTVAEAIRIAHTGGGAPQFGSVSIPLSVATNVTVDSILVCYKTVPQDPTSSSITSVALRTMTVPTSAATILSNGTPRTSVAGQCDAIDVVDQSLDGAPTLVLGYTLGPITYIEIGAIGIKVKDPTVSVVAPPLPASAGIALAPGRPNPFRGLTRFDYSLAEGGPAELRVFDVSGRSVRSLLRGMLDAGTHRAEWDGRDDHGRVVPSGVYLARLETARGIESERVIHLR